MRMWRFFFLGVIFYPFSVLSQVSGIQEYFVMGRESALVKFFQDIVASEGCQRDPGTLMKSVVTVTATEDNQTIIYDHWEDGYEEDVFNPQQASTEVHILNKGEYLVLSSDGSGTGLNDYVPTSPRGTDLRYDGGDRIVSIGGPVNVVHNVWPSVFSYIGGAIEIYSRTALSSGNYFTIPVGEDSGYASFNYVTIEVEAFEDDTLIIVDNGSEVRSVVLNRGDSYITNGYLNNTFYGSGATAPIQILNNTVVQSSKPVQISWYTGGTGCYQTRFLNVIPTVVYGQDYVVPLKGFTGSDVDLIIYNPNDTVLNITVWDKNNLSGIPFAISATSVVDYYQITGSYLPSNSSARITGDLPFWVIALVDYGGTAFDWGFSLIPTVFLQPDIVVSWAPACDKTVSADCSSLFSNHLWVTPSQDNTEFMVDFDGDGVWDTVDVNCDGTGDPGPYVYNVLDVMKICEPSSGDYDLTGTRIVATGPFAISYGEDPDVADGGLTSELDLGYTVLPLEQAWVEPVLTAEITSSPDSVTQGGGTVSVEITISSYDFAPIDGVDITAQMPGALSYVNSSAVVTFPDGTTSAVEPAVQSSGSDILLLWDLNYILYSNESVRVSFKVNVPQSAPNDRYRIYGRGVGYYRGSYELNPEDYVDISKEFLDISKFSGVSTASYGDSFTFYVKVENTSSNQTSTNTYVEDFIPVEVEFTGNATANYIYDPVSKEIKWGPFTLYPGEVSWFTFEVRSLSQNIGACIENSALLVSDQVSSLRSNSVCVEVTGPLLTAVKSQVFTSTSPGDPVTYTITLSNTGNAPAKDVLIVDRIPSYTGYLTGTIALDSGSGFSSLTDDPMDGDNAGYNHPSFPASVTLFIPVFPVGATWTLRFSVFVSPSASPGTSVVNSAYIEGFGINRFYTNIVSFEVGEKDSDGDGITDAEETSYGCTDPYDADSDDDGVTDGSEVNWYIDSDGDGSINACDPDSDDDGIYDGTEMGLTSPHSDTNTSLGFFIPDQDPSTTTDPLLSDTDSGGVPDGTEDLNHNGKVDAGETDPLNPYDDDYDGDLIPSREEFLIYGTDPYDADTDDDGVIDGVDGVSDADGDGLINALDPDSDNDGILDGTEKGVVTPPPDTDQTAGNFVPDADPSTVTDYENPDTDGGGAMDGIEDANHNGKVDAGETNPLDPADDDNDMDGLNNTVEMAIACLSINDADTDDDGIIDGVDGLSDPDGDGLINACDPDSDNDGIKDGTESGVVVPPSPDTDTTSPNFVPDADPSTVTDYLNPDTDGGGVPDGEEDVNANGKKDYGESDPRDPGDDDRDGDGLINSVEEILGTDPADADTDDDGLTDAIDGTVDSDGDGIINALDPDSDNDGLNDGLEEGVTASTAHPDTDTSSPNFVEDKDPSTTTSHFLYDTDGGGAPDGVEDVNKDGKVDPGETDPLDPADDDPDGDQLFTVIELVLGTDYLNPDSDGDGISDYVETDGGSAIDTDGDGVIDARDVDSDGDGLNDVDEGTGDPDQDGKGNYRDTDSDEDGLSDRDEVYLYFTDPYSSDTDGGGVNDGKEVLSDATDPLNPKDDGNFIVGGGCGCSSSTSSPDLSVLFAFLLLLLRKKC